MGVYIVYNMNRGKTRRKKIFKKQCIYFLTFCSILGFLFSMGCSHAEAQEDRTNRHKYYKSIELKAGDTLWDIAQDYADENCDSTNDYIRELMSVNGLESEDIHEGQYLTIPYYKTL